MKIGISVLIFIFAIFMSGCSAKQCGGAEQPSYITVSIPTDQTEDEVIIAAAEEETSSTHDTQEINWRVYADRYGAEYCFLDIYMPEKHWLIGDEYIVQLTSLGEIEDVIAIKLTSIDRTEYLVFDEYVSIEAFDRTKQTLSIMASPVDAEVIIGLLR